MGFNSDGSYLGSDEITMGRDEDLTIWVGITGAYSRVVWLRCVSLCCRVYCEIFGCVSIFSAREN